MSDNNNSNNDSPFIFDNSNGNGGATEEDYQAELWEFLQESRDMRLAAKNSLQQGLYAGGGAVAGGLLLGPVGGLVGGVTGSLVGFFQTPDYDGAVQQLVKIPQVRQSKLLRAVGRVLSSNVGTGDAAIDFWESPETFRRTLAEYASRRQVRDEIWRLCTEAIKGEDHPSSPEVVLTS